MGAIFTVYDPHSLLLHSCTYSLLLSTRFIINAEEADKLLQAHPAQTTTSSLGTQVTNKGLTVYGFFRLVHRSWGLTVYIFWHWKLSDWYRVLHFLSSDSVNVLTVYMLWLYRCLDSVYFLMVCKFWQCACSDNVHILTVVMFLTV